MPRAEYRRQRKERGLCVDCPNETGGRSSRCKACKDKELKRKRRKKAGRASRVHPAQEGIFR